MMTLIIQVQIVKRMMNNLLMLFIYMKSYCFPENEVVEYNEVINKKKKQKNIEWFIGNKKLTL